MSGNEWMFSGKSDFPELRSCGARAAGQHEDVMALAAGPSRSQVMVETDGAPEPVRERDGAPERCAKAMALPSDTRT